jgi:hypothetical protein
MKDPRLQLIWTRGFGNECGRLFQGIRDIPGTIIRRLRHFNGRYHNFQDHDQQHPLHQGRRHDDDGH